MWRVKVVDRVGGSSVKMVWEIKSGQDNEGVFIWSGQREENYTLF